MQGYAQDRNSNAGRSHIDPVMMFKMMALQQLYNFRAPRKIPVYPEAPIETHVLAGVGLGQWSRQGRFFEVPFSDEEF
jgi:hypothetical protein